MPRPLLFLVGGSACRRGARHPAARRFTLGEQDAPGRWSSQFRPAAHWTKRTLLNSHIALVRERLGSVPMPFRSWMVRPSARGLSAHRVLPRARARQGVVTGRVAGQSKARRLGAARARPAPPEGRCCRGARRSRNSVTRYARRLGARVKRICCAIRRRAGLLLGNGSAFPALVLAPSFVLDYVAAHRLRICWR